MKENMERTISNIFFHVFDNGGDPVTLKHIHASMYLCASAAAEGPEPRWTSNFYEREERETDTHRSRKKLHFDFPQTKSVQKILLNDKFIRGHSRYLHNFLYMPMETRSLQDPIFLPFFFFFIQKNLTVLRPNLPPPMASTFPFDSYFF